MENFDLKKYLAEGKLLKEEPKPYTDEIRKGEVDGLAADIELEGDARQKFISDLMKATKDGSWGTFYDIADKIMSKYLAEGKTLNESAPGYDTRKQGEALPTLESVKAAYEAKNDIKEDESEFERNTPDRIDQFNKELDALVDEYHAELYLKDDVFTGIEAVKMAALGENTSQD